MEPGPVRGLAPVVWAGEHEAIIEAIAAGDGELAQRLTREHIERHPPVEP